MRRYSWLDRVLVQVDGVLNVCFAEQMASRPNPADAVAPTELSDAQKRDSRGFMRVNHTGEVCAQALYQGQLVLARDQKTVDMLKQAAIEETDHLAWTHQRLDVLETHRSYLNRFWYMNSFLIGMVAARMGDDWSLGFVEETERQVTAHLTEHMMRLPEVDLKSRAIVEQMRADEIHHGSQAAEAGARELPGVVKAMMCLQARVMTTLAFWI